MRTKMTDEFQEQTVAIAGCGALGSLIAYHLAIPGRAFILIDDDLVEEANLETSAFHVAHVKVRKTHAVADLIYRKARCETVFMLNDALSDHLSRHPKLRHEKINLLVDAFDNTAARSYTHGVVIRGVAIPTLHVGVAANRTGAVEWDEGYVVPEGVPRGGEGQICTHEIGRQILRFTAAVAAGIAEEFLATGAKRNLYVSEDMRTFG